MNKRLWQIVAVVAVALGLIGAGVFMAVTGSSKYALYQMYHAAEVGDATGFATHYKVYESKSSPDAVTPPALETFKKTYFHHLSAWDALTRIKTIHENLTPDGGVLIVNSQTPHVAYQFVKRNGIWVALSAAILKQ